MKQKIIFFVYLILCSFHILQSNNRQNITILGTGYVGLVLGAGLAELGHHVTCADIDVNRIQSLKNLKLPFFEPDLEPLVTKHYQAQNLEFTDDLRKAICNGDVIFIAVPTPSQSDGSADLQYVYNAFNFLCDCVKEINEHKIICIKSTVPIGTAEDLKRRLIDRRMEDKISIVSNPEFLRQGSAVFDLFNPDRIIIGGADQNDVKAINALFGTIAEQAPTIFTDNTTAELIKYVSNTFLAVKLSFINEIDSLCSKIDAHMPTVIKALGMDKRIGPHYMQPGPGFGGSCLPKDSRALLYQGNQHNIPMRLIKAALDANQDRKHRVIEKIKENFDDTIAGKKIGIVGLSFKPNTDDTRESPAIDIITELLSLNAQIFAYDVLACENMKKIFPRIYYCKSVEDLWSQSDLVVVLAGTPEINNYADETFLKKYNCPIIDTQSSY